MKIPIRIRKDEHFIDLVEELPPEIKNYLDAMKLILMKYKKLGYSVMQIEFIK